MYIQVEGKQTLLSPTVWLNDLIIHAASLQLICKELVNQDYRLTLTIQERGAAPHCAACNKHANCFMMGLLLGYSLFVVMRESRFVIV